MSPVLYEMSVYSTIFQDFLEICWMLQIFKKKIVNKSGRCYNIYFISKKLTLLWTSNTLLCGWRLTITPYGEDWFCAAFSIMCDKLLENLKLKLGYFISETSWVFKRPKWFKERCLSYFLILDQQILKPVIFSPLLLL